MGQKTNVLMGLALRHVADVHLLPALSHLPQLAASRCSSHLWNVHFYALALATPNASFCCVSRTSQADNTFNKLAAQGELDNRNLSMVPARFGPDRLVGMTIRPSLSSTEEPLQQHWLSSRDQLTITGLIPEVGLELLHIKRRSDQMEFLCARCVPSAQVAMAWLAQRSPLWAELHAQRIAA